MELHIECLAEEARLIIGPQGAEALLSLGRFGARLKIAACVELCKSSGAKIMRADLADGSRGGVFSLNAHPEAVANLILRELLG